MKRNPVNILNDTIAKASEIASNAVRISIMSKRLDKFNGIDLRHYKGQPERKERIKTIRLKLALINFNLMCNFIMIMNQPIQIHAFTPGTEQATIGESKEEIIINRK